jgi:hypothetical protein
MKKMFILSVFVMTSLIVDAKILQGIGKDILLLIEFSRNQT